MLLLTRQRIYEEHLEDKTNMIYQPLTEAGTDTWREKARVHETAYGLNAHEKEIRAGCFSNKKEIKMAACCCQKSDQNAVEQPNSLITQYFARTENAVRLHREEFLEGIPLCLSAAGVLHMEGHFPSHVWRYFWWRGAPPSLACCCICIQIS